ncbi:F0F1 ATP synthase subunit A [Desulfuromonas sp. AOP6]|uniref:F0F1 ATP synthase subunit A n=1 Tax=Desulfuromonas sp. AOP6 TaxID=1566351 RepID=UPI00127A9DCA|nr:F0F1 ATP synthase subunit A [Desulfuromonas sp. AOP6]BCA79926.1 ATP synthase subunit a 1 [Desulfuromonas sp. AOP6]
MEITPDASIYWQYGFAKLNATILVTWLNMLLLAGGATLITMKLTSGENIGWGQNLLEVIVDNIRKQIEAMGLRPADEFLPFIGTLFLFILFPNILAVVPGYRAPTGSLSTTAALSICVFIAVPVWGIRRQGLLGYLKNYIQPTPLMLPFNVLGELSRTLALAVRLFGNIMSGAMIAGILLSLAPLLFPVLMNILGLITGVIQAYIFAVLATVYLAAAVRVQYDTEEKHHKHKQ